MKPMYLPPAGRARRGFLRRGLWGGALLALGGGGYLALRPSRKVPLPVEGLLALSDREYAVVQALAERLVPVRNGFASVDQVRAAYNVDRVLARADAGVRKEVKQLLGLFENALPGLLFGGRWEPFSQLTAAEQDTVLREWESSRLALRRTGFQALRTLVVAAYYGSPLAWPGIGYPGPPAGFWQKDAPEWRGAGAARPDGNGVFHAEAGGE
jgi:hypothetical protein